MGFSGHLHKPAVLSLKKNLPIPIGMMKTHISALAATEL
jgi:hypothetical protein